MSEIDGKKIIELFDNASKFLKWPRIKYILPDGAELKLVRTGPTSRYPGAVSITAYDTFFGYIFRDGKLHFRKSNNKEMNDYVITALEILTPDPVKTAKINGQQYNHCCFCGLELTNSVSVTHGYGPICAEKWGLPWSEESRDALKEEIERDEIADEVTHLLKDC